MAEFNNVELINYSENTNLFYIYFSWSAKKIGFGQISLRIKDNINECNSELMSKKFVKEAIMFLIDHMEHQITNKNTFIFYNENEKKYYLNSKYDKPFIKLVFNNLIEKTTLV